MEEIKIEQYVGIPFKSKGRDYGGVDCWGLVRLVYQDSYGIELESFTDMYTAANHLPSVAETVRSGKLLINCIEKVAPAYGDVIMFNIKGQPVHVGIYIGNGKVLHVMKGTDSCCERLSSVRLKGRIEGYYEIR